MPNIPAQCERMVAEYTNVDEMFRILYEIYIFVYITKIASERESSTQHWRGAFPD